MNRGIEIDICSEEEWPATRLCLVRSFSRYSLYVYLIPDDEKRTLFLQNYLEAVYDVTVRRGNSVLMCGKIPKNDNDAFNENEKIIIGGVLLVPPSESGGWECARDEDFWDAYEKYKLREIDEEALRRIKRYEGWEYENVTKHICDSGIPMWNGIICGMDPRYAARGWGNMAYDNCIKIIRNLHKEIFPATEETDGRKFENIVRKLSAMFSSSTKSESIEFSGLLVKLIHSLAMLSHRSPIMPDFSNGQISQMNGCRNMSFNSSQNAIGRVTSPIIFTLSHSRQSVYFRRRNGFSTIAQLPYVKNQSDDGVPFTLTAMLLNVTEPTKIEPPAPRIIPCKIADLNESSHDKRGLTLVSEIISDQGSLKSHTHTSL